MDNEIKEKIYKLRAYLGTEENWLLNDIVDYITNLQEENGRLKELVNPTTQIFIDTQDMEERYGQELYEDYLKEQLEDYKSRNEKAINEVIRVLQIILEQPSKDKTDDLWIINKLEGIQFLLQGEDNE